MTDAIAASSASVTPSKVVVKIGTSSITEGGGRLDEAAMAKLCDELHGLRDAGHQVVLVSSAAIAAGMARLELTERPRDFESLQALSAVGQIQLMSVYDRMCAELGFAVGQVLLAPPDFFERGRYLRARSCLDQLLAQDVLPIINENDAVADDAIRFGDNDRIAALVAQLIGADLLILLTDTAGLLTADPNVDASASLIEEIVTVDAELEQLAGGAATTMSQGGMASKLSAAKIASWSGVTAVIAAAHRDDVLADVVGERPGVGTVVRPRQSTLSARKLWIAFALGASGTIRVDEGAKEALLDKGVSLLPVGVVAVVGTFAAGDAVEICGPDQVPFAKGLVRCTSAEADAIKGQRTSDLADDTITQVIHRDDMVVLP